MLRNKVLVDQGTFKTSEEALKAVTAWLKWPQVTVHMVQRGGTVFADCWRPETYIEARA